MSAIETHHTGKINQYFALELALSAICGAAAACVAHLFSWRERASLAAAARAAGWLQAAAAEAEALGDAFAASGRAGWWTAVADARAAGAKASAAAAAARAALPDAAWEPSAAFPGPVGGGGAARTRAASALASASGSVEQFLSGALLALKSARDEDSARESRGGLPAAHRDDVAAQIPLLGKHLTLRDVYGESMRALDREVEGSVRDLTDTVADCLRRTAALVTPGAGAAAASSAAGKKSPPDARAEASAARGRVRDAVSAMDAALDRARRTVYYRSGVADPAPVGKGSLRFTGANGGGAAEGADDAETDGSALEAATIAFGLPISRYALFFCLRSAAAAAVAASAAASAASEPPPGRLLSLRAALSCLRGAACCLLSGAPGGAVSLPSPAAAWRGLASGALLRPLLRVSKKRLLYASKLALSIALAAAAGIELCGTGLWCVYSICPPSKPQLISRYPESPLALSYPPHSPAVCVKTPRDFAGAPLPWLTSAPATAPTPAAPSEPPPCASRAPSWAQCGGTRPWFLAAGWSRTGRSTLRATVGRRTGCLRSA